MARRPKRLARVAAVFVGREANFLHVSSVRGAGGGRGFEGSCHRRSRLHRLESGRRTARARRRGGRARQPYDGPQEQPRPRDRAAARSWSWRTSATASWWRRCSRPRSPRSSSTSPRRSTCACRPPSPLRRRGQRDRHDQHARGRAPQRGAAVRVRVDRRRDLRRDRRAADAARTPRSAPRLPTARPSTPARATCGLWRRLHGLSTVSLRFGNVYGPRQDPLGEAGVIAIFCGKLQTGGEPTVFGDGRQTRDYVYRGRRRARMHDRRGQRRRRRLQRRPRRGGLGARPGRAAGHARRRAGAAERARVRAAVRARARRARCSAARSTRHARARCSASRPRSTSRTACAARCSRSSPSDASADPPPGLLA